MIDIENGVNTMSGTNRQSRSHEYRATMQSLELDVIAASRRSLLVGRAFGWALGLGATGLLCLSLVGTSTGEAASLDTGFETNTFEHSITVDVGARAKTDIDARLDTRKLDSLSPASGMKPTPLIDRSFKSA